MYKYNVVGMDILFSFNSFEEWANANEEQNCEYVQICQARYYDQIRQKIKEVFPNLETLNVGESTDFMMATRVDASVKPVDIENPDYENSIEESPLAESYVLFDIQERINLIVEGILGEVDNDGSFWEVEE